MARMDVEGRTSATLHRTYTNGMTRSRVARQVSRAAQHLVELRARLGGVRLGDREELLGVRADDAVLQEVGAREGAEAGLLGPLLVERDDLDAGVDAVELAVRDVPAEGGVRV